MRLSRNALAGVALAAAACSEPLPYAVVTVEDPLGLAGTAAEIAYGRQLTDLRGISMGQSSFPFDFLLYADREQEAAVWIEARAADGTPLALGRAGLELRASSASAAIVELGYVCDRARPREEPCASEADLGGTAYTGVCLQAGACSATGCGDGFPDAEAVPPEECDDGNQANDDDCPDGPGGTCLAAHCGDGFVWQGLEGCDDQNVAGGDGCTLCQLEILGPPAPLDPAAVDDEADDTDVALATDGAGRWVMAWSGRALGGGDDVQETDIVASYSTDLGHTWSTPVPVHDDYASDDTPDLRVELANTGVAWVAVWRRTADRLALASRSLDGGVSWDGPVTLWPEDAFSPGLAAGPGGRVIAVWHGLAADDPFDAEIYRTISTNHGASWSAPVVLNADHLAEEDEDTGATIATDGGGWWIAAWARGPFEAQDIWFSRSGDAGESWSSPAPINANSVGDERDDILPQLLAVGDSQWLAVWQSAWALGGGAGPDLEIVVARSTDAGSTWSTPRPLNRNAATDEGDDVQPVLARGADGQVLVTWTSHESFGGLLGTDGEILFSRSTDAGVVWTSPSPLNLNATSDLGADYDPAIAVDAAGNVVAAWISTTDLQGTGNDADVLFATGTLP